MAINPDELLQSELEEAKKAKQEKKCGFCGKDRKHVKLLITGIHQRASVTTDQLSLTVPIMSYICDKCVCVALGIVLRNFPDQDLKLV